MRKYKYPDVLKKFMQENFDFEELVKVGLFKKEWKNDYESQANKICHFFGYENVFEYGSKQITCHLSMGNGNQFTGTIKSLYE